MIKPVRWIGSSKKDLSAFPDLVKEPLRGFTGAGVLEVVADFEVIFVLHAFQKKSRQAVATPKAELDLIRERLARAREDYEQWRKSQQFQ